MATLEQIDANRRNAQLSTGPVTDAGKAASARNALQSGIYSNSLLLPGENSDELAALLASYQNRFQPVTPEAQALVDSVVHHEWLLRRLRRIEASFFADDPDVSARYDADCRKIDLVQRRINASERNYHRSLKALQALRPPAPSPELTDPKSDTTKLASFPQNSPPYPDPDQEPASPPLPRLTAEIFLGHVEQYAEAKRLNRKFRYSD